MKFPSGSFDDQQLASLQIAFDIVCNDLGVGGEDVEKREWLAKVMMSCGRSALIDINGLKSHAAEQFKLDGAWREPRAP